MVPFNASLIWDTRRGELAHSLCVVAYSLSRASCSKEQYWA